MDFTYFEDVLLNAIYACHDYVMFGFPTPGQPLYSGSDEHRGKFKGQLDRKTFFMRENKVPIWNGEFGPVYANEIIYSEAEKINKLRFHMLEDQLSIYEQDKVNWSIWLYKDIGYQGIVYVNTDTPYMKLIAPFVAKKQKLALDFWGCVDKEGVKDVYGPFVEGLRDMVLEHIRGKKYPHIWSFDRQFERAVRECLMSEYMGWEFAGLFQGKTEEELEELAKSFAFENCIKRDGLNSILQEDGRKSVQ